MGMLKDACSFGFHKREFIRYAFYDLLRFHSCVCSIFKMHHVLKLRYVMLLYLRLLYVTLLFQIKDTLSNENQTVREEQCKNGFIDIQVLRSLIYLKSFKQVPF